MEDSLSQLQAHFQTKDKPKPSPNINFQQLAEEQVKSVGLGLDPAQLQLATVLATIQIKSQHKSNLSMHLLQKSLLETSNAVSTNKQEIWRLHN